MSALLGPFDCRGASGVSRDSRSESSTRTPARDGKELASSGLTKYRVIGILVREARNPLGVSGSYSGSVATHAGSPQKHRVSASCPHAVLPGGQIGDSSKEYRNAHLRVPLSEVRSRVRGADTRERGLPGCPLPGVQSVGGRAASVRFHGAFGWQHRLRLRRRRGRVRCLIAGPWAPAGNTRNTDLILKRFLMPGNGRGSLRCKRPRPSKGSR